MSSSETEVWNVDRLFHPAVPLTLATDADDALVYVGLGGVCSPGGRLGDLPGLVRHAARHGARLVVERRAHTEARRQLRAYLEGSLKAFDLPLRPLGTPFQRRVWEALLAIPRGRTWSYGEQARFLGLPPGAARAVGHANGLNPLPIVIPCHRVIGRDGRLTGFGGGLPLKRWLLELESTGRPPSWIPGESSEATQLGLFA